MHVDESLEEKVPEERSAADIAITALVDGVCTCLGRIGQSKTIETQRLRTTAFILLGAITDVLSKN